MSTLGDWTARQGTIIVTIVINMAGQYRHDSIVINKDGKPVAALVDAELFARIRRMREHFESLSDRIAHAYGDVPAEQGMAEIEAAVAAERNR
jgi:prevent-host-death family protein